MPSITLNEKTFSFYPEMYKKKIYDLNIVSNFQLNENLLLKESIYKLYSKNWLYFTTVEHNLVSIQHFLEKIKKSEILAYRLVSGSFANNNIYDYGWVPINKTEANLARKEPFLLGSNVWPNEVYFLIQSKGKCFCGVPNCFLCEYKTRDEEKNVSCLQKIKWDNIFLYLGEKKEDLIILNKNELKGGAERRNCKVCIKCVRCNNLSNSFCKTHRICRHKTTKLKNSVQLKPIKFKNCNPTNY